MADMLVPITPLVLVGAYTSPAFHIFREIAKVVLKPIEPRPSKTIPQLAQSTPSTPSTILEDDGRWFPTSLFANVPAPAFTPEPTPIVDQTMQAAAPVKNLDHLPDVLSSDPARAKMVFIFVITSYLLFQVFARHLQLRRRFSPVTHIVSTAIAVCIYILIGPASHGALLNMPVTLQHAKESALPVVCATLATFSVFNTLVRVVESMVRNVLSGIGVSAVPESAKKYLQGCVLLVVLAPAFYCLYNGLLPFEVTVRREINNNLASVDPRFVAIVTMTFVALCVVDMLLGFVQSCSVSLLGLSVSTLTCGPVVLVVRIFQALAYVVFRCGPLRRLTDSPILAIAYTFRTWASYLKDEVELSTLYDLDDSSTDVSSTRGMHQGETGLADAARPADASDLRRIRYLEDLVSTQRTDLCTCDSEITRLNLRIEDDARAYSRKQSELTSALQTVSARDGARDAKIANLQWKLTKATEVGKKHKSTIDELRKALMKPQADAGVQTLPVVFANTTPPTIPAVEKAEMGVQVDQVAGAARVLVDASTQHSPVLVDSATQTTETPRVLVDSSAQVQEPPRQVKEIAIQTVTAVFADSTTQTDVPPPTVPVAEHEEVLMELEELHRRLQDVESEREVVEIAQPVEEVYNKQEAHEQDDPSIQLPNGGPKVSIQAFAAFLGARLNQALAPQVVDSMTEGGEEENEEIEAVEILHDAPTSESSVAPVTDTTAPIPNVSPDMYAMYEAIAGKKFTIPADPDVHKLDQMPLRQWIMTALQKLYVDRLGKYSEVIEGQLPEQVQVLNDAATQALGQGNHTLMIAMWQLAQAHTLSKMSPEEAVKGSPAPAYVTVDWKWKKPMDDDRIGKSFYKLQRHVLDAIRDKTIPNPFVVSALNLMELSIAYAERLYADIKEPDWFKNSSNLHIRQARRWIKLETGVWVMDEDLVGLAELIQTDWDWKSSFKTHLKFDVEQDPGYALLQIKRGMELERSVAEEAGEQPSAELEEKPPKKRSDGVWGHGMAHYSDQVKEEYDEPSVDESIQEEEEEEADIEVAPMPQPAKVQPVETQTIQSLEEPEAEPVPPAAVELDCTAAYTKEEKGKGKGPALVRQNHLTEAEKELGPANFEPTPNFSWVHEPALQPATNTQPPSTNHHPQQGRVYHNHPSLSFHGRGNNRGIPLQVQTERNPNLPPRPAPPSAPPTADTQASFASGMMASIHAPKLTGSMASMHAPRPTGLYASIHAPSPPTPQSSSPMASEHAPRLTGSMASMHAPRPSTSPAIDRHRGTHADDPSPPASPSTGRANRNRGRGNKGSRSGLRLGSRQLN